MSGVAVKLTVTPKLPGLLRRLERELRPGEIVTSGLMLRVGKRMQRQTAQAIREARHPETGAPWKPTGSLALAARPGGGSRGRTLQDTGQLRQSIIGRDPVVQGNSVTIGSDKVYAALHQRGGTIRPKRGKYLAVPATREARRAGSARRWMSTNKARGAKVLFGAKGPYGLGFPGKSGGEDKVHFRLLRQVTIPARPFLGFGADLKDFIRAELGRGFIDAVRRARRGGES